MTAAPILSLCMRPSYLCNYKTTDTDDLRQEMELLRQQAARYVKSDYFAKRTVGETFITDDGDNEDDENDGIDAYCREKMVDWSFRVCDHFRAPRHVVAYAFSFLDRFAARHPCDRAAFKLASMTSLYIATKLFNNKQLSIASLAELSRGEFSEEDIASMESRMLHTLDWRMNPPTSQDFILLLCKILPETEWLTSILQHALFFAELSVYDSSLITEDILHHAISCILCAMDVDGSELRDSFMESLSSDLELDIDAIQVESLQVRLWYLFSCSAQPQEESTPVQSLMEKHEHHYATLRSSCLSSSPVSVQELR